MKQRTDYVSNSSSASFILRDSPMLKEFSIDKQKLIDTFKALLPKADKNRFQVYDLQDGYDLKKAEDIRGTLECFYATDCYLNKDLNKLVLDYHNYEQWDTLIEALKDAHCLMFHSPYDEEHCQMSIYKYNEDGTFKSHDFVNAPDWIMTFIQKSRERLGILTNWEVCLRPESKYLIHFDDNAITSLQGYSTHGKNQEIIEYEDKVYQQKLMDEVKNSPYITEYYTLDRIMELLVMYWENNGIIDKNSEFFHKPKEITYHFSPLIDDVLSVRLHEG